METWMMIAIGAAVAGALLALTALAMWAKHRRSAKQTSGLREGFGPEYTRAVGEKGRSGGEQDLLKRQERAGLFPVRSLSAIEVAKYNETSTAAQAQFATDPGGSLAAGAHLLTEVLAARGYPVGEFEQSAVALSVDHPRAVQDYRAAHEVLLRNQRNPVPLEELQAAVAQNHAVFTELMDGAPNTAAVHAA